MNRLIFKSIKFCVAMLIVLCLNGNVFHVKAASSIDEVGKNTNETYYARTKITSVKLINNKIGTRKYKAIKVKCKKVKANVWYEYAIWVNIPKKNGTSKSVKRWGNIICNRENKTYGILTIIKGSKLWKYIKKHKYIYVSARSLGKTIKDRYYGDSGWSKIKKVKIKLPK